jgi:LysM repeat protein
MKILKILGIAAGLHALALLLIFANPGCSYTKAASTEASPISSAPTDATTPSPGATITTPDSVGIRYSPTRPGTTVATALASAPVSDVTPASTYTIEHGDTLSTIAKKNQLTKVELAVANHLKTNAVLHVGQKLVIPAKSAADAAPAAAVAGTPHPTAGAIETASTEKPIPADSTKHIVKAGETLGGIARKYGVRQGEIAVANNITDPRKIHPGQELVIPARSASSSKPSRTPKTTSAAATPAPSAAPAAAADQDLDAGLKPASPEVPIVKIDDAQPASQPKNP